jgi:hypothetical protein
MTPGVGTVNLDPIANSVVPIDEKDITWQQLAPQVSQIVRIVQEIEPFSLANPSDHEVSEPVLGSLHYAFVQLPDDPRDHLVFSVKGLN